MHPTILIAMIVIILLICSYFVKKVTFYYTNWCHFCAEFKPVWAELKAQAGPFTWFYEVNCDEVQTNVDTYPTIEMKTKGKKEKYSGPRDVKSLTAWINSY